MNNTDINFKTYLYNLRYQLILFGILLVFLSSVIWYFYPTYSICCDAAEYWKISDDLSIMNNNPVYGKRTFVYPLLIQIARYIPQLLKLGNNVEYISLSLLQLFLHYLSTIVLGYAIYISTKKIFLTSFFIYIFGLDIFLIAYTNQILTDGVAVSFLSIAIAFLVRIAISHKNNTLLAITFGLLTGLLPMIRPALFLVSIALYTMFLIFSIYKHKQNITLVTTIFLSLITFLIPLAIQTLQNPHVFEILSGLGKFHIKLGSYMFKYVTIVDPTAYGYGVIDHKMKELIDSCEASYQSNDCIKYVLTSHPLKALSYYAKKIFALNDQVYLTPYIHNFYAPERHLWRLVNCTFLASSLLGLYLGFNKIVKNIKQYFFAVLALVTLLISLILPLITSVPEERFGLTFHPFLALGTSCFFCNILVNGKFTLTKIFKTQIKMLVTFSVLIFLLFSFSAYIESKFGIRLNG